MSIRIHGAEHPLKEIFSDDFVFEIPSYQRPYSWTTEQAGELLEDLLTALGNSDEAVPDPYFLGSIVLAKKEHQSQSKVIDGQQRLTTLTILLSALAALANGKHRQELRDFIFQEGSTLKQTLTIYRLTLRPRDAEFFREYIQEDGGLEKLVSLDKGQLTDPQANIQANAALFRQRLEVLSSAERAALASYLLNHCFLVTVSTPDTDSAFKIFTVLNDRGLDLSHADIIKSELIGKVPVDEQERYTAIWEDAEESLGIEPFADLFSHLRMIYAKTKQREVLIKEYRSHVLPQISDPQSFIKDVVAPFAEVYARIRHQNWQSATHAEDINRTLGWLGRLDNVDWIPPAISYLNANGQRPDRIAHFLARLERLAASLFVRRVNVNGRIDRYGALLKQIEEDSTFDSGSALELSEDEKSDTINRLKGELYLERRIRSYVLLRLDEALSAGGAQYDQKILTVEHVLPQNPRPDSEWRRLFSDEQREFWVHRVANLVLLPRQRNSAAQNYDFEKKKRQYFSSSAGTSPFAITTQVLNSHEWNPDVLTQRERKLLDVLAGLWELDPA